MATTTFDLTKLSHENRPGRLYKLAPGSVGLDNNETAIVVDESQMAATAIISTPTPDRVRDVLMPRGCRLENYQNNPVVLWEHGFDFSLPIAKSADARGKLAITIDESGVAATSYFTHRLKESEQIFALIAEGIIRATSVRATPLESRFVSSELGEVLVIDQWDLEEWSWVAVPCNPEAVAGLVSKNRLAGSPIAEPILKSLKQWIVQLKIQGCGSDVCKTSPSSQKPVSFNVPTDVHDEALDAAPSSGNRGNLNAISPEDDTNRAEVRADVEPQVADLAERQPLAKGCEARSRDELGLIGSLRGGAATVSWLEPLVRNLRDGLDRLEPLLWQAMKCEEEQGGRVAGRELANEEGEQAGVENKAWQPFRWKRCQRRLKTLVAAENLTSSQRAAVESVLRQLATIGSNVKNASKDYDEPENRAREELDALRAMFGSIEQSIREARPYRART